MQTHQLWEPPLGQQLEGHQSHMGRGWSDWKEGEFWASHQQPGSGIVPSPTPLRHIEPQSCEVVWPHPGQYLGLCPIQLNRYTKIESRQLYLVQTQGGCRYKQKNKYSRNEWTGQNLSKRTKWCGDSQPIRHRVQNTGGQNAQRSRWIWQKQYRKEMKALLREIKKNPQETNSGGKEGFRLNQWFGT